MYIFIFSISPADTIVFFILANLLEQVPHNCLVVFQYSCLGYLPVSCLWRGKLAGLIPPKPLRLLYLVSANIKGHSQPP